MVGKNDKDRLKHSEDLVREVFDKPLMAWDIVYNKDEIHQINGGWDEANPMLKYAIQHLNHKKYKRTWEAYLNGKEYADRLINKIVETIEQYREVVKQNIHNAKLPLTNRGKEYIPKEGEYSQKWINHLIFDDVLQKFNVGYSPKKNRNNIRICLANPF